MIPVQEMIELPEYMDIKNMPNNMDLNFKLNESLYKRELDDSR